MKTFNTASCFTCVRLFVVLCVVEMFQSALVDVEYAVDDAWAKISPPVDGNISVVAERKLNEIPFSHCGVPSWLASLMCL